MTNPKKAGSKEIHTPGRMVRANDESGRWDVLHEDGYWLAVFESESEARRYAAAPDLQQALTDLKTAIAHYGHNKVRKDYSLMVAVAAADKAIAKAEGKP